jgi:N-acetylmuramoyl-L-alanine amidase
MLDSSSNLNVPVVPPQSDQSATPTGLSLGYLGSAATPVTAHKAIKSAVSYTVQPGDVPSTIATHFGVSTNTILWANNLSDGDNIKPGQTLTIPPVSGVLYQVTAGDTVAGIAAGFKTSADKILAANDIDPDAGLTAGQTLMVPDGVKNAPKPAATTSTSSSSSSRSLPSFVGGGAGFNNFPYGYCTWWVAHQRSVTWSGNAWEWYYNAQAAGRPVGRTPVPGAVMVTWESPIGHVAYVESVSGNSFTVSEMNYAGWGVVSHRTLSTGSVPLIGFIY